MQGKSYSRSLSPSAQAFLGMPRAVGLDLAAADVDVDQPLPALALAEVDCLANPALGGNEDGGAADTRYLCLSADNRRAQGQPAVQLYPSSMLRSPAIAMRCSFCCNLAVSMHAHQLSG